MDIRSHYLDFAEKIDAVHSYAQIQQDLFILCELNFKRNGFFVEFGATDGIKLSNTYLLEKEFGWTGVLVEPARCYHDILIKNRKASLDFSCIWESTGASLPFVEVGHLSTIDSYKNVDFHRGLRQNRPIYDVYTLSLHDLLLKHRAPEKIDYLSIDTEGSEYDILKDFCFDKYDIKIITVEHNHTELRDAVFSLLTSKGYSRKFEQLTDFDDWFVKN